MNRLVIIGNGFDLAHGLPTSYKHFIEDFWENLEKEIETNEIINKKIIIKSDYYNLPFHYGDKHVKSYDDFKINLSKLAAERNYELDIKSLYCSTYNNSKLITIFQFRNQFFHHLCETSSIENWVDIENEYYNQLKKIASSNYTHLSDIDLKKEKKRQIEKLNDEFNDVKNLLEKYLKEKVVEKCNFNLGGPEGFNFHNIFFPDILDPSKIAGWREDFSKKDKEYIDELIKEGGHGNVKLRFLNFNYTPTLSVYFHMNRSLFSNSEYFIHGKLSDPNNKINFGFGDEMDDDYKIIENINENEYLKNFKSFQYLQNDIYKKLLDFIEGDKFEVFIMGSSCGLSDRTLLNTIFENENCRLIKVFYHQWEDENTKEIKDNFTELTQNISRHFNDKKLMRSKIVHKKPEQKMPSVKLSRNG